MDASSLLRRLAASAVLAAGTLGAAVSTAASQGVLQPGEAIVTRFSGTAEADGIPTIDRNGTVAEALDLRSLGGPPSGSRADAPHRAAATADQVGQVFAIAIADDDGPVVYLSATSAFGLHRTADNSDWMPGMWGADGGPGSIYVLRGSAEPSLLSDVTLGGRENSAPGLGNIAYDSWNHQFFVSDLETGMIHRLRAADGFDLGHYDHGTAGRKGFHDAATGAKGSLPAVAFDAASAAHISNCPSGDFARTASCWNFADFRRRVWGLGVLHDTILRETRLYYSVWGSQGFGNPDYAAAGDDQRNSVWSVRLNESGDFDTSDIRREFFLPDFFRSPEAIARGGRSNPVTDIAFSTAGGQAVMLLAERGGVRNLGLTGENAFAYPHEARLLRYELDENGNWPPDRPLRRRSVRSQG
jgi:hypothetical protein